MSCPRILFALYQRKTTIQHHFHIYDDMGKGLLSAYGTYADRWSRDGKKIYSQNLFLKKMVDFIRENRDRPYFLFHPTQLPHGPVSIPEVHPEVVNNPHLTPIEKEYATMVKCPDDQVGIIMQGLKNLGIAEHTIIVFSSDNGHEIYFSQKERCEKPYRNLTTGKLFDDYTNKYYSNLSGHVFNGPVWPDSKEAISKEEFTFRSPFTVKVSFHKEKRTERWFQIMIFTDNDRSFTRRSDIKERGTILSVPTDKRKETATRPLLDIRFE